MRAGTELHDFEGLIAATAARYAPILDHDEEDVRQVLRIKVWQALSAYDKRRVRSTDADEAERIGRWVFSCVKNRVKDLLKEQDRLNARRNGGQCYIEDVSDDFGSFEGRYLSAEDMELRELEEASVQLPSTLTEIEVRVVRLLVLEYSGTEISLILGVSRRKVREAHAAVQEKMADWQPSSPALERVAA